MTRPTAAELLRSVGLLADGPVRWGQPVPARGPGLYLVELPAPLPTAPLDLALVGKWLERVPGLRLDGARPSSRALLARLASLWLPDATVLYAGATATSIGGRTSALVHHVLGDPRPHADGQWLHALRDLGSARLWWAATDAQEEYLDALLDAFAVAAPSPVTLPSGAERPAAALLLPWATTRRPTGERQAHGLTGSVLPLPDQPVAPPTRVVEVPPGDADGARVEERGTGTTRRAPRPRSDAEPQVPPARHARSTNTAPVPRTAGTPRPLPPPRPRAVRRAAAPRVGAPPAPVELSPEAHARLAAEHDELTRARRPEVVARIKAARELGDLRENAEYHAAREEQSFLEGRIQLLEQRLRNAVIVTGEASVGARVGSRVTIEAAGETLTYTLVGSAEADAAAGRISTASPVGAALLGSTAGAEVSVRTPRGEVHYRVVAVE
ncbi:MAG TPA: transcription elongation factor GreA [Candidatus Limnocylindrales bacterium]|nr:transcription elongation factor GreA [Candidatus Limnocylindrales bacterium]